MSRFRKKKGRSISGWLVLDKPAGIGSTQCVSRIKSLYKSAKTGHAGTLDPLASGMLPIALGEATKTVSYVMDGSKTYQFTVKWGEQTSTDDLEGEVVASASSRPGEMEIRSLLSRYTGNIQQTPPAFCAVKINGERAYKLARNGENVPIKPRSIIIDSLDIIKIPDRNHCLFEIKCGKGTYVRSLSRDMGRDLGCFGHISQLRRSAVYPFCESDLIPLESLMAMDDNVEALDRRLLKTGRALGALPQAIIDQQQAARLRSGNTIVLNRNRTTAFAKEACAVNNSELIAIGRIDQGVFHPKRVFISSMI